MSDSSGSARARSLLHGRDFRLFLAARALAALSTQIQTVAVGWQVYEIAGDPMALGYVGLALFLPAALCTLPAGDVADRFDRRRVIAASLAAQLLGAVALAWLAGGATDGLGTVYAALACIGAARALAGPAQQSFVPLLVPPESLARAIAWTTSAFKIATILGPAVGGALLLAGPRVAFGAAAAMLALAWVAILAIRGSGRSARLDDGSSSLRRLLVGIEYVWRSPVILGAISLDLFAVLLGGVAAVLPIYARDVLMVGPEGLGLMRSMLAVGGAGMAIWLGWRPIERAVGPWMLASVAAFGLTTLIFGLSTHFALSLAALAAMGAADMVSVYVRQTTIQLATPDGMRGRVSSVSLLFIGGSNELGEFRAGSTAAWMGTMPSVVFGGACTLAVVALWSWRFAALRRLDRFADAVPR
jgi:MFS family permease